MSGYVYFILDRTAQTVKIGYSKNPRRRLADIQVGNANDLELVYCIAGTRRDEGRYHETFYSLLLRGEWYRCAAFGGYSSRL